MVIKTADISNFSVFKRAEFEFCPGVNVLIGENATGKSHLLKLLYSILKAAAPAGNGGKASLVGTDGAIAEKLRAVFRPGGDGLGRLVHRRPGRLLAKVAVSTDQGAIQFTVSNLGNLRVAENTLREVGSSIFIPAREMFSTYEGFQAAVENRELAFDDTYRDLCVALSAAPAKGARAAKAATLAKPLEEILGGSVELSDGRFFVNMKDGSIEAHLLAEGLRKIASLLRLVVNGSLAQQGFLFWDEPEANLNPMLMKKVADLILALGDSGVQIFLATHDYLISQELSLAAEYGKAKLRFFGLSRSAEDAAVKVEQADTLPGLQNNPILDGYAAHYDRERELFARAK